MREAVKSFRMNQAISQAIQTKDVQDKLDQNDFITVGGTVLQTGERIQADIARWTKTVKESKARTSK